MNRRDYKRLIRIQQEFYKGFEYLNDIKKGVVIFGSAQTKTNDKYYKLTYNLAYILATEGFDVITGSGPACMEAGNKGALEAGGKSVGIDIVLQGQNPNKYTNKYIKFNHFYTRKVMFTKYSFATVLMPGGYGSLDEIFEQLTLVQTKKIKPRPFIIMGKEYYRGLYQWLKSTVLKEGKIKKDDLELMTFTDDIQYAVKIIKKFYSKTNRKFFI